LLFIGLVYNIAFNISYISVVSAISAVLTLGTHCSHTSHINACLLYCLCFLINWWRWWFIENDMSVTEYRLQLYDLSYGAIQIISLTYLHNGEWCITIMMFFLW